MSEYAAPDTNEGVSETPGGRIVTAIATVAAVLVIAAIAVLMGMN